MRTWLLISIAGMALILCACTDTFLVYKKGKGYFLGSNSAGKYELLCATGDLKSTCDTTLSKELKDSLYKYNCWDQSGGKDQRGIRIHDDRTEKRHQDRVRKERIRDEPMASNAVMHFNGPRPIG